MYEVEIVRNALIPTDGGELAADLYLPKGALPGPALVMLLPYNKDWCASTEVWQANHYFARHGYASLLIDFRGTGSSSGVARAPFDNSESDDGVAAVEWAASQPWCNGNVGMWGCSYGAITSMRTAARRPKSLKAIIPIMGNLDPERDFIHPGGRRGCLAGLTWGLQNLLLQLTPPLHMDTQGRWRKVWADRLTYAEPYFTDLVRHGPSDPIWRTREVDATQVAVPSFCVAGWRDVFADGMIRAYEQVPAPKALLAGPWMHVMPYASPSYAIDFLPMMLQWWDRWLRGVENDNDSSVTVFIQGSNQWRRLAAWPPAETEWTIWFSGADNALQNEAGVVPGIARKRPDATIGSGEGLQNFPHCFGMPTDQSDDDRRGISFTSSPLETAVWILGRARMQLSVSREGQCEGSVVAKLADVDPDGRSMFITEGMTCLSASSEGRLQFEFAPTSYELAAGHRLRLTVANGSFPRLWPDPNPPELVVNYGGAITGTQIHLPIVPLDLGEKTHVESADPSAAIPPHVLKTDPLQYQVVRDSALDCIAVSLGMSDLIKSTNFSNTVLAKYNVSASVPSTRPRDARLMGNATAEIKTEHGSITIRAEVLVTDRSAIAEGTVAVDGKTTYARRWAI